MKERRSAKPVALVDRYAALERRMLADPALLGRLATSLVALGVTETARVGRHEAIRIPFPCFRR